MKRVLSEAVRRLLGLVLFLFVGCAVGTISESDAPEGVDDPTETVGSPGGDEPLDNGGGPGDDDGGTSGENGSPAGGGGACDIQLVLSRNECTVCHSATPEFTGGGLDLVSDGLAERLIDRPSANPSCATDVVVDLDVPQASLLLRTWLPSGMQGSGVKAVARPACRFWATSCCPLKTSRVSRLGSRVCSQLSGSPIRRFLQMRSRSCRRPSTCCTEAL